MLILAAHMLKLEHSTSLRPGAGPQEGQGAFYPSTWTGSCELLQEGREAGREPVWCREAGPAGITRPLTTGIREPVSPPVRQGVKTRSSSGWFHCSPFSALHDQEKDR